MKQGPYLYIDTEAFKALGKPDQAKKSFSCQTKMIFMIGKGHA